MVIIGTPSSLPAISELRDSRELRRFPKQIGMELLFTSLACIYNSSVFFFLTMPNGHGGYNAVA